MNRGRRVCFIGCGEEGLVNLANLPNTSLERTRER